MSPPHLNYATGTVGRPLVMVMWVNLALCIVAIGVIAALMLFQHASGGQVDGGEFLVSAFDFSPFVALGCIAFFLRHDRDSSVVILVTILLAAGLLRFGFHGTDTSESSIDPLRLLDFLLAPILQWGIIALAGVIVISIRICRRVGI